MAEADDPLEDALRDLRVSGSVLLHEAYGPGWAIEVPAEPRLRALLAAGPELRAVPFHLVRRGQCEVGLAGERLVLTAPELSLVVSGAGHRLSDGGRGRAVPLEAVLAGRRLAVAEGEAASELVCGAFLLRATPCNPLLGSLPDLFKVPAGGEAASAALAGVAQVVTEVLRRGGGGGYTMERLLEVLCAEAIRAWCAGGAAVRPGWLAGLRDRRVSEAIRLVHAAPGEAWTVAGLAGRVALSPSRFAQRFREVTGQSAMAYVAGWRANAACRLLRESDVPLAEVARRVGYDSVPAFSRAFRARVGVPPAAWRRREDRGSG